MTVVHVVPTPENLFTLHRERPWAFLGLGDTANLRSLGNSCVNLRRSGLSNVTFDGLPRRLYGKGGLRRANSLKWRNVIPVPCRRLEDKIQFVCALAVTAQNNDAWLFLPDLRVLLRQHTTSLRAATAAKLSGSTDFIERRSPRQSPEMP